MDWRHKAGQQDHRDHEHEQVDEHLLHVLGDRRDGETEPRRADHEDQQRQEEREEIASKGHVEPVARDQEDHEGLEETDEHGRRRLADEDLGRRERRDEQLVKRPLLALLRNREAREEHDLHEGDHREERRQEGPARELVRVEPGARLDRHRLVREAPCRAPVGCDVRDVVRDHRGDHRVAAIRDDLDRGLAAVQELFLEVLGDDDGPEDLSRINQFTDLLHIAADSRAREGRRSFDVREEVARRGRARIIDDGIGNLLDVVVGRVAEQETLDDDRHDELDAHARVLEEREQLLLAEEVEMVEETDQGSHDSTFFRVM